MDPATIGAICMLVGTCPIYAFFITLALIPDHEERARLQAERVLRVESMLHDEGEGEGEGEGERETNEKLVVAGG
jgi:hypothetical protein